MTTRRGTGFKSGCWMGVILVSLVPRLAGAALGEPESSVTGDLQMLKGSIKSTVRTNYQVHEIRLPSGTLLREYAAVGGAVFAVAWSGPATPDLRQALGRYFDVYVSAVQGKPASRRHLAIEQGGLVLQSSGRMRAFSGRAYLPAALPAGISVDEIR